MHRFHSHCGSTLLPCVMLTYVPISIAALVGKVEWKPICHTRVMTLEQIEEPGLRAS